MSVGFFPAAMAEAIVAYDRAAVRLCKTEKSTYRGVMKAHRWRFLFFDDEAGDDGNRGFVLALALFSSWNGMISSELDFSLSFASPCSKVSRQPCATGSAGYVRAPCAK